MLELRAASSLPRLWRDGHRQRATDTLLQGVRVSRSPILVVSVCVEKIGVDMQRSKPFRRAVALASLCAMVTVAVVVGAVAVPSLSVAPASAAGECLCAGGEYHALTPERIFDSRPTSSINDVSPVGAKPMGPAEPSFDLQLLGKGGVPLSSADVLAVAVSITIANPGSGGYLTAFPAGTGGTSSLLNFGAGQTIPNLAIVRGGTDGKLTVKIYGTSNASANVLVDVLGWFSSSTYTAGTPGDPSDERGARLVVVNPARILDTRSSGGLGPGAQMTLQFRGASAAGTTVPNDPSIVGALVNVTAVLPTASTFVSVVPTEPVGVPTTSNLNVPAGRVQANLVMVPVGPDGAIHLYNSAGTTNLLVDVMGYLQTGAAESSRAGRVIPLTAPYRALDTRQTAFGGVPLGPGQAEDWSFAAFSSSVTISGIPVGNQAALLGNLTNASLGRLYPTVSVEPGYLTVYPADAPALPVISNLNNYESSPVPNMALIKYGANQTVRVYNASGYAHYILDVSAVVLAD